ncbi:hypothetical protein LGL08_20065 [Clostridium estertheticum]|uniref:hypothetical protein n=1 Tax=Clostridium estertheticum TaxID=238834 RepID=UPI001CF1BE45|nr:hypothetical protein [Clostridium estertheticum]MCB2309001.1 hypothetical protein [Clostridium estertheticum]MCB2346865.1 hypothetical protein [Clostridium estertheticum]MCB2351823.1 hypothetical protein [Clostridium estertheticum]WAG48427.1 hypothetical protein LL127_22870 [Clostridium estertheticum]
MNDGEAKELLKFGEQIFKNRYCFPKEMSYQVHVFNSREELYLQRISMTKNETFKQHLELSPQKYMSSDGCYIIPPLKDYCFDILLVHSQEDQNGLLLLYNFLHELTHICNISEVKRLTNNFDYLAMFCNPFFTNWDEFKARYISSILFFKDYCETQNRRDVKNALNDIQNSLMRSISDEEIIDGINILRYNLMQYLGFVAAKEDGWSDGFEMPQYILQNNVVNRIYNELKEC